MASPNLTRTVVVGVDGSEPSIRALLYAASLVEDLPDAELIVAHARYIGYLVAPRNVTEDEFSDVLDGDEQYVRSTVSRLLDPRPLRWSIERREGEPSKVLTDIARDVDASLLIIGRQGRSNVKEMLLGSVSNRLVHLSEVPVLVVR
jgi:nucleotide-binding universal stress UspA family protein